MRTYLLVPLLLAACAQAPTPAPIATNTTVDRMDWWREARFGLFLHWGLYAIPAGEWNGRTTYGEWIRHSAQIPVDEYDQLVERFNPVEFDADAWARMAKAAGMRYIVITSKHHDGFCLFDSQQTDFDVMSTPFGRDILAELADACRRHGLKMCWYHSIMDWHHPDYLPRRPWEEDQRPAAGADFDRYVRYLHGQITELLTRYGPIGVMWFDGEWEATWTHAHGVAAYELCRHLQPNAIVNNRVDKGRGGMAGLTEGPGYVGDFGTPEQEVPATGFPGVDWETCMTMNRHWGWNKSDGRWKSTTDLVRMLVDIASKGGNFLLNVGPTAEGTFPPEAIERLEGIGSWMEAHGDSIWGTRASPFAALPWGRCTWRATEGGARLYLHVFEPPEDGDLVVPGLGNDILGAGLLANGKALSWRRRSTDVVIALPPEPADPHCTVVSLDLLREPIVYLPPEIEAPAEIFVKPMAVHLRSQSPDLALRYTTDGSEPNGASPSYHGPISVAGTTTVKVRAFHKGRAVTPVVERTLTRVQPRPPVTPDPTGPGLRVTSYEGSFDRMPDFASLQAAGTRTVSQIALESGPAEEDVALVFEGFLQVPDDAVYTFAVTSDDGSRLLLGGDLVVDNDGLHGTETRTGHVALGTGLHPLRLEWFNKTGGGELSLRWAALGEEPQPVPAAALLLP